MKKLICSACVMIMMSCTLFDVQAEFGGAKAEAAKAAPSLDEVPRVPLKMRTSEMCQRTLVREILSEFEHVKAAIEKLLRLQQEQKKQELSMAALRDELRNFQQKFNEKGKNGAVTSQVQHVDNMPYRGLTYTGDVIKFGGRKIPHGKGKMTKVGGAVYEGNFSEGLTIGGKVTLPNGDVYDKNAGFSGLEDDNRDFPCVFPYGGMTDENGGTVKLRSFPRGLLR